MSTSAATASVANGHVGSNGTAKIKTSSAKSRSALKRLKAKQKAAQGSTASAASESEAESGMDTDAESVACTSTALPTPSSSLTDLTIDPSDPAYAAFAGVFKHFTEDAQDGIDGVGADGAPAKGQVYYSDDEDEDEEAVEQRKQRAMKESGMTRRERRKAAKLSVAELKQLVERPEVVEWFDTDARDPRLLVTVKSYRNTVPVPVHWNAKRDYLAGKRGLEKPPYLLPQWIAETGIGEQRDALKAKEADQTLRQKTRERVQPKMGKMDIDYQRLHDAFFRFQGKPSMSKFGEAYYEGKELETDLRTKKPGELSDELVEALSIPPLAPPPWLIAMQRFGPPPSYPNLRIKGLNAPIPAGAQWGFHPGGWGKPPMDDFNRPLYGDVFGVVQGAEIAHQNEINKDLWGEIEQVDVESEEEESDEEEEEEGPGEGDEDGEEMEGPGGRRRIPPGGTETPSGLATPSGMQSITSTVPGGLETPEFIDLRKQRDGTESEVPARDSGPRDLYTVIPERETSSRGFMGSTTAYDVAGASGVGAASGAAVLGADDGRKRRDGVEISITETDDLSQADLKRKYEESRASANRVHVPGADVDRSGFDDVVAGEMKKRQRKDEKKGKEKEKYKF